MTIAIIPRAEVGQERWDALVATSPDAWIWASFAWQEAVVHRSGLALNDAGALITLDNQPALLMPAQRNRAGVLSTCTLGAAGPIRLDESLPETLLPAIRRWADGHHCRTLELASHPLSPRALAGRGVNEWAIDGFIDVSTRTRIIDLTRDESALWEDVSATTRRKIRRAKDAGMTAERVSWRDCLDRYVELHELTYVRSHITPRNRSYFEAIRDLFDGQHAFLFAARDASGRIIAFHNSIHSGVGAGYWTGCSADDEQRLDANYVVMWEAIVHAKRSGCTHFEVGEVFPGSIDSKLAGLSFFKQRFGGTDHRHLRARSVHPYSSWHHHRRALLRHLRAPFRPEDPGPW